MQPNQVITVVHLIAFAAGVTTMSADSIVLEHRQRFEPSDVAKLAAVTQVDHSTIFFHGHTKSGYVRNGAFHQLALNEPAERRGGRCRGRAVSRDGSRIAYVVPTAENAGCTILVRDLRTDMDSRLGDVEESWGPLAWSWPDDELAYQRRAGIFAVSVKGGRERTLAHLPIRISGQDAAQIRSLDWFHNRSGILANAVICVPTGRAWGECQEIGHVLTITPEDSRIVAQGVGAAVSPERDEIGFVTSTNTEMIDVDQLNTLQITPVPFTLAWMPLVREDTWWSQLVWSPQGDRFWFSTVLDEEFNSSYYLVDVRSRLRRRLLTHTSLDVTDWR